MSVNPSQVIISREEYSCPPVVVIVAHHRDFPEIRAEGETPRAAAGQLANELVSALEATPNGWHRGELEEALADVRSFVEQSPEPSTI